MKGLKVQFKVINQEKHNAAVSDLFNTRKEAEEARETIINKKVEEGIALRRASWQYTVERIY